MWHGKTTRNLKLAECSACHKSRVSHIMSVYLHDHGDVASLWPFSSRFETLSLARVDDEDFDVSKAEQEQATMSARVDTYYCLPTNPAGAEVDDIHDDDLPNVSETPYNYKESDEPVEAATGVRVVQVTHV